MDLLCSIIEAEVLIIISNVSGQDRESRINMDDMENENKGRNNNKQFLAVSKEIQISNKHCKDSAIFARQSLNYSLNQDLMGVQKDTGNSLKKSDRDGSSLKCKFNNERLRQTTKRVKNLSKVKKSVAVGSSKPKSKERKKYEIPNVNLIFGRTQRPKEYKTIESKIIPIPQPIEEDALDSGLEFSTPVMEYNEEPKRVKKSCLKKTSLGSTKKSIYINDKVNYDKILKSYFSRKGQDQNTIFVYNKDKLPQKYFTRKDSKDGKLLGAKLLNQLETQMDQSYEQSYDDGEISKSMLSNFRFVPPSKEEVKIPEQVKPYKILHDKEMKMVSKLKRELGPKSLGATNVQTFSLPSLNSQDLMRLKTLENSIDEPEDSYRKGQLNRKLSKVIPKEDEGYSIAQCSAKFLTKHVKSLNRISNDYSYESGKNSPFNSRNPSMVSHSKTNHRSQMKKTPVSTSVTIFENSISKHKNKLMKVLEYNPMVSIQEFIKRVEKSETLKEEGNKDQNLSKKVENCRYKRKYKAKLKHPVSFPKISSKLNQDLQQQIDDVLSQNRDEIAFLKKKLLIDDEFAHPRSLRARKKIFSKLLLKYHPDKVPTGANETQKKVHQRLYQYLDNCKDEFLKDERKSRPAEKKNLKNKLEIDESQGTIFA
ncbi:unnamed protein product [Moneuplotes crassus]|uniref:J domain-containing protein n=1 Tax=Euplotes crassus TaxID=5936 RepID=A0AAD2D7M9_EUPCR|nr:unnamed protein product [Moneuplotes crassus]